MGEGPKVLASFPRGKVTGEPLFDTRAHELSLFEAFGEPVHVRTDDFGDPIVFWDVAWPCGLHASLEYHQLSERLRVRLDEEEIEHALRHLDVRTFDVSILAETAPELHALLEMPGLDFSWELWRVAADGNRYLLDSGLTERDASCRRQTLSEEVASGSYLIRPTPSAESGEADEVASGEGVAPDLPPSATD